MRFIAFDLETTGTLPGVDQIAEIGALLNVKWIGVDPRHPTIAVGERESAKDAHQDSVNSRFADVELRVDRVCRSNVLAVFDQRSFNRHSRFTR